MRFVLLLLTTLLVFNAHAQKAKAKRPVKSAKKVSVKAPGLAPDLDRTLLAEGQAVALDTVRGTLATTDAANQNGEGQKRYFDRYTLTLRQGDLLLVEYASEAYRVMLGLEPPGGGGTAVFSYDSVKFENVLSKHLFRFPVPTSGVYTLLLTSADAQKTGAYRVRKFILPGKLVMPPATSEFCQKLTFLLAQSQLNFDRLMGRKTKTDKKTGLVETYQSVYEFTPGKPTEIVRDYDLDKTKFNATLAEFNKKDEALKALETYAAQLKTCTPGWKYETLEGDTFKEISAATYADFLSVSMRILGRKKFAVVLGVD